MQNPLSVSKKIKTDEDFRRSFISPFIQFLAVFIFIPGPMVEAVTQLLIY